MTAEYPPAVQSTVGEQSSSASAFASGPSAAPAHNEVAVGQADVSAMQKNDSGRDVGGKGCCRNGTKRVVLRRDKTGNKGKRDIQDVDEGSSAGTGNVNRRTKRARRDNTQKDSDKEPEEHHIIGRKGRKNHPDWMTNGTPPLEQRTTKLIDQLSQRWSPISYHPCQSAYSACLCF
jgi:hypothetical protein